MPNTLCVPRVAGTFLLASSLVSSTVWAGEDEPIELVQARTEIPEAELLDVGIQVFDPGLPAEESALYELEQKGTFADIRKSEARYIPFRLMQTLQSTGYWGAVRLVPAANRVDLMITGTILSSNGKELELEIQAVDAAGTRWLRERYKREANPIAYHQKRDSVEQPDAYQDLYHQIANDLLERRTKIDAEDIERVRRVSQLTFAVDLAPTPFGEYLAVDGKGRYSIHKLPAVDDPMMRRVAHIRERDYMFIDTLNEFYAGFCSRMEEPYDSWRAFSYEEQMVLDQLRRAAMWEKILGAAAIFGGVMARDRAGSGAVIVGTAVLMDGMQKSEEAKMHVESLRELAASLDADVAPLLIDVEGEVTRLSGSVETQYETWRSLLRRIFASETGLPLDPNTEKPLVGTGPAHH